MRRSPMDNGAVRFVFEKAFSAWGTGAQAPERGARRISLIAPCGPYGAISEIAAWGDASPLHP